MRFSNETDLSTKQEKEANHLRLSQEDEHSQGAPDHQPTTTPRTQKAHNGLISTLRPRFFFPKAARITKKRHYVALVREGKSLAGRVVSIQHRRGYTLSPLLGITVSRRYGKAHERNRFKRLAREAFRLVYAELPENLEIHVSPHKFSVELTLDALLADLRSLKRESLV